MPQTAINAYATMQRDALTGRDLEASVLMRAAALLKSCQERWDHEERDLFLSEAIRFNQAIWSVFQAELSQPDNPLPPELKQNILNLSLFVDKRSMEILADPQPEKLSLIININLNIAAGLSSSG